MFQFFIRPLKRFTILIPGVIITYVSIRDIFPYFDRRLPLAAAIFITYVLGAYVLVPAVIRLYRIVAPASHLPLYCVTPDGFASDPVNIGIIGTRLQLITALQTSGWFVADPKYPRYLLRHAFSTAYGWNYPNAPVSNLYLFGRKQDIAFEIPLEQNNGSRHHVRFWATTYETGQPLRSHNIHWQKRKSQVLTDKVLWVGAASLDNGLGFIRHNLQITHMVHPDTNIERNLIVKQLHDHHLATKTTLVELGRPYRLVNRVFTASLHADGKMAVVTLDNKLLTKTS